MNEYLNKKKSSGDYGRRETLPPSLQTKMNQSFGMDFSSVKLYRNDEMAGTGMQGLAAGNRVILSKDVDLNSKLGQAVLGHELSHIRAQSQGIGMGNSGLYNNAALERQADAEGLMAANGQPIFGDRSGMNMGAGMGGFGTLTPLSGGLTANAGAPMQAKKPNREEVARQNEMTKKWKLEGESSYLDILDDTVSPEKYSAPEMTSEESAFYERFTNEDDPVNQSNPALTTENGKRVSLTHTLSLFRLMSAFSTGAMWGATSDKEIEAIYNNLASGDSEKVMQGYLSYKTLLNERLLKMEKKYGKLLTQMNPIEIVKRMGQSSMRDITSAPIIAVFAAGFPKDLPEEYKKRLTLPGKGAEEKFHALANYYSFALGGIYTEATGQQLIKKRNKDEYDFLISERIDRLDEARKWESQIDDSPVKEPEEAVGAEEPKEAVEAEEPKEAVEAEEPKEAVGAMNHRIDRTKGVLRPNQKGITRTDLSEEEKRDVELYARHLTQTNVFRLTNPNEASPNFDNTKPNVRDNDYDDICAILYEKEKASTFVLLNRLDKEDLMKDVRKFKPDPKVQKAEVLHEDSSEALINKYLNINKDPSEDKSKEEDPSEDKSKEEDPSEDKYKEEDPFAFLRNECGKEALIDMSFDEKKDEDQDDETIDKRHFI